MYLNKSIYCTYYVVDKSPLPHSKQARAEAPPPILFLKSELIPMILYESGHRPGNSKEPLAQEFPGCSKEKPPNPPKMHTKFLLLPFLHGMQESGLWVLEKAL